MGCLFHCKDDNLPCSVMPSAHMVAHEHMNVWPATPVYNEKNILEVSLGHFFHSIPS